MRYITYLLTYVGCYRPPTESDMLPNELSQGLQAIKLFLPENKCSQLFRFYIIGKCRQSNDG